MKAVRLAIVSCAIAAIAATGTAVFAHCQIPCGIYDDEVRFALMREHVTTIEKSMNEIEKIGGADSKNWNQLVRWVSNKEHHAEELTDIVTFYFMAQRVKAPQDHGEAAMKKYTTELTLLHGMIVHAMKAKQTTDQANVKQLRELIDQFEKSYMGNAEHTH